MKPVAKHEFRINNILNGIHEYVPITFDEMHFCIAKASVHSLLIDFKYKYIINELT
jgi:hypothetical protein